MSLNTQSINDNIIPINYENTLMICNYCGKKLKSVKNCNKHENKCKDIPTKKKKDFLENRSKEELDFNKKLGIGYIIKVIRTWNDYEWNEMKF